MLGDSGDRVLELAPERIRYVAKARRTIGQPLQFCGRNTGRGHDGDPAEAGAIEFTGCLDFEVSELLAVLFGDMGDRKRKTGRHGSQQHFGRPGAGVVSAHLNRLVDRQLELANFHSTLVPAGPTGGDTSHG